MSVKLYSYGDSHAAGHELGTAPDLGKAWLKENFGTSSRYDIDEKTYNTKVRPAWEKFIRGRTCNPQLSYSGQLAKILDIELVDRAIPGSSNDWSAMRLLEDLPNIKADDLVLFSVCTPERFLSGQGTDVTRTQIQWQPEKIQRVLYQYGPSDKSFNLWTQAIVHMIKNISNCLVIKTTDNSLDVNGHDTTDIKLESFTQFALRTAGHEDIRYPVGHIHEDYHKMYAEYLCLRM
jgi:hypothetical protein